MTATYEGSSDPLQWVLAGFAFVLLMDFATGSGISANPLVGGFSLFFSVPVAVVQTVAASAFAAATPLFIVAVIALFARYKGAFGTGFYVFMYGCMAAVLLSA